MVFYYRTVPETTLMEDLFSEFLAPTPSHACKRMTTAPKPSKLSKTSKPTHSKAMVPHAPLSTSLPTLACAMDVAEHADRFVIAMELPGARKEDIQLSFNPETETLSMSATKHRSVPRAPTPTTAAAEDPQVTVPSATKTAIETLAEAEDNTGSDDVTMDQSIQDGDTTTVTSTVTSASVTLETETPEYHIQTRRFGIYKADITVPPNTVDATREMEASFSEGVLTVQLFKRPPPKHQTKIITIQ